MRDPTTLTSDELIPLVEDARWFAAKGRALESAEVVGVPVREGLVALAIVEVRFAAGTHEHYLLALGEDDEPGRRLRAPGGRRAACGPRRRPGRRSPHPVVRRRAVEQLRRARRAARAQALPAGSRQARTRSSRSCVCWARRGSGTPHGSKGRSRRTAPRSGPPSPRSPHSCRRSAGAGSSPSTRSATTRRGCPTACGGSGRSRPSCTPRSRRIPILRSARRSRAPSRSACSPRRSTRRSRRRSRHCPRTTLSAPWRTASRTSATSSRSSRGQARRGSRSACTATSTSVRCSGRPPATGS